MQLSCPSCGCAYAADQAGGLCPRCLAAMAMKPTDTPVEETPIEPGETFHDLQVQKLVARGGMGVVYRARQPKTGRDVALKILPRSLALEEEFRLRFDREARALAGLSHPNIVNLIDYGIDGDLMFLVMEFVEGVSLRQSLRDKTLTPARSLRIALDLCEALHFAHREGVIHRDVKPENILIDPAGRVKLTDFGLAKKVSNDSTQLTQTNLAVGTPHYMAPEQLEQPKTIDHRVDIYSLGVVLYEMLVRELPIGRFPAPSQKAGVDPRLDAIVYRCLSKDPDQRYRTISELREALKAVYGMARAEPARPEASAPAEPPRITGNLEVICPCGGRFRVPAAARGLVHCPSCGEPVTLRMPAPGTARATAPIEGTKGVLSGPHKLILSAAALMALVMVLAGLAFSRRSTPRVDENVSYTRSRNPAPPAPPKESVVLPNPTPVLPSPVLPKEPREAVAPVDLRLQIDSAVIRANMAGLVAAILANSGKPTEHEQLQRQIAQINDEIKEALLRLEEQGLVQEAPDRFRPGDKITFFGGRRVTITNSMAFADELRGWLRAFRPGITERVMVTRKNQVITLNFSFPERSPELVALAHQVGIVLGETPGYVPTRLEPKPSPVAAIPVGTLAEIRGRLEALPAFYRGAIPYDDRGRAEALILAAKGSADDVSFLTGRFSELVRKCEVEQKSFTARIKELEAGLADPSGTIDTILFKDGHKVEGLIIEETEETFKVKGSLGTLPVERDKVLRIERGKSAAAEFRTRYQAARGGKTELLKVMAYAREKNLQNAKTLTAYAILALDPGDERCRQEVGLQRNPFIASAEVDTLLASEQIEYRGKLYTAEQLRLELKSMGYVQLNGVWCEKVPRVFRVDNLYRDEAVKMPATFVATSIQSQVHSERDTVYDYKTRAWIPRTKLVAVARYVGGSGTCLIEIAAPGDIVECRVHARGQVPRIGGFLSVSIVVEPREAGGKVLYTLSGPGENDGSHDVTDKVIGRNRFYIRADINGEGMFLPSDSNDLNVLEVKYTYGKPLEKVNAVFAAKRLNLDPNGDLKSNNDTVESNARNIALTAAQSQSMTDALAEMRKLTEGMVYLRDFSMPPKFEGVAQQLKDPLFPDWNGLTRDQALKLGSWWGLLGFEERRDFLAAYGVWCARSRYLRGSK